MSPLRKMALALDSVDEGVACAGTALESRTYRVKKKAFLFISTKDARLKLEKSKAEAKQLGFEMGAQGWVKLPLDGLPPAAVLARWIAESHALLAGGAAPKKAPAKKRRS